MFNPSSASQSAFSDIVPNNRWERLLPQALIPLSRLSRFDRPIGWWLLLLPGWWVIALASAPLPDFRLLVLFLLGAIIMRGAGCTFNDLVDQKFDIAVERTRVRPLPAGQISQKGAVLWLLAQLCAGLFILLQLSPLAIVFGTASLLLVFTYPFMKRITWWPQAFLGLTFNWGVWLAAAATGMPLSLGILLLYAAGITWTLGYDTIYAAQDMDDDAMIGVKSTARRFGKHMPAMVIFFYMLTLALLVAVGVLLALKPAYYVLLLLLAGYTAYLLKRWQPNDQASSLWAFKANKWWGLLLMLAFAVGH